MFDDWELIESSFAQQYNIRIRKDISNMEWAEFSAYLSGLNGETALGNIVRIRTEKNTKAIKNFSKEEKRIHSEWKMRKLRNSNVNGNKMTKEQWCAEHKAEIEGLKSMFVSISSSTKGGAKV